MTPEDRAFADYMLGEALSAAMEDPDTAPRNDDTGDYGYGPTGFLLGKVLRENGFSEDEIPGMLDAAYRDAQEADW